MAAAAVTQSVLLRRSNLAAKVPTTDQLQLGELGVNTTDGRVFLKKDNAGTITIEQLVVTGAEVTGSINILGTGSFGVVITPALNNINKLLDLLYESNWSSIHPLAWLNYHILHHMRRIN